MDNVCFVCGLGLGDFERANVDFTEHVHEDHNMCAHECVRSCALVTLGVAAGGGRVRLGMVANGSVAGGHTAICAVT